MSDHRMVLFAIGPDRPGLVKEISSVIHEAEANLEDSRMAVLAGDFALIVLFSGSEKSVRQIQEKCNALEEKLSFKTYFKPATMSAEDAERALYDFQVVGIDQPGIVHLVSTIFADLKVNVVSLESRLTHAAFHGTSLFKLKAEIQVRESTVLEQLSKRLDKACEERDLSYELKPAG